MNDSNNIFSTVLVSPSPSSTKNESGNLTAVAPFPLLLPSPSQSPSPSPSPGPTPISDNYWPEPTFDDYPPPSGGLKTGEMIGLIVGIGILIVLVAVGVFVILRRRKRRRSSDHEGLEDSPGGPSVTMQPTKSLLYVPNAHARRLRSQNSSLDSAKSPHLSPSLGNGKSFGFSLSTFTYEELAMATNGFSNTNLLGQGGFGYVHKGILPDGREVAVKKLKDGSGQGEREFQAEVEIISRIHHRHLVSLVGYCTSGTERMLVYEFVANDTLGFHLHGKGRPTMSWETRMKIALGSAKGMTYLHEDCQPRVVHRDIKASNILLDSNFNAKVADFGLAKFFPDAITHVSTLIKGTVGYLDPEYASTGQLTDKSDIFSFGVMLLELITGQQPFDGIRIMVDWARPLLTKALEDGNFDSIADPMLQKDYDSIEMRRMVACAAVCVRHSARLRPRMSQIVRTLEGNISLDDQNKGMLPAGQSIVHGANETQENSTSEQSVPTSEYRTAPHSSFDHPSVVLF